jgi:D-alanyl-D-alanine carboxypeptidase
MLLAGALVVAGVVAAMMAVAGRGGHDAAPTPAVTESTIALAASTTTLEPSVDAPGSLWWVVNRDRPLPAGYVPSDLVTPNVPVDPLSTATQLSAPTAAAFEAMVADGAAAGFHLQMNSGYRSQGDQQVLYDRNVRDYGEEVARQRVALPGTSEHQTGLAVDVGEVGLPLDQVFGDTAAAKWVENNAYRFGFILRYPPDKAAITGYANEPWHLRYVGTELASILHGNGLTMEEYFSVAAVVSAG